MVPVTLLDVVAMEVREVLGVVALVVRVVDVEVDAVIESLEVDAVVDLVPDWLSLRAEGVGVGVDGIGVPESSRPPTGLVLDRVTDLKPPAVLSRDVLLSGD